LATALVEGCWTGWLRLTWALTWGIAADTAEIDMGLPVLIMAGVDTTLQ
jgi:hypothetical protein